jgi:hypothetical protein
MHPLLEQLASSSFENMTDTGAANKNSKSNARPFAGAVESFASPDQDNGKGTTGPQQSQTVTSFSAHMSPWATGGTKPPRKGRK